MKSRFLFFMLQIFVLGILLLAGCGPAIQAQPGAAGPDILPSPPPMPTSMPRLPTPTLLAAPTPAPQLAGAAAPLLAVDFAPATDLRSWTVVDAAEPLQAPSIWQVQQGHLRQVSDGTGSPGMYPTALLTGDASWRDYTVSIAAYPTGNDELGLVARASAQGFYVLRLLPDATHPPRRILSRYDAATQTFTPIASADGPGFVSQRWYSLRLQVQGDQLQAFVDDQLVLTAHDATFTQGQVGAYGYAQGQLAFDNLIVQRSGQP